MQTCWVLGKFIVRSIKSGRFPKCTLESTADPTGTVRIIIPNNVARVIVYMYSKSGIVVTLIELCNGIRGDNGNGIQPQSAAAVVRMAQRALKLLARDSQCPLRPAGGRSYMWHPSSTDQKLAYENLPPQFSHPKRKPQIAARKPLVVPPYLPKTSSVIEVLVGIESRAPVGPPADLWPLSVAVRAERDRSRIEKPAKVFTLVPGPTVVLHPPLVMTSWDEVLKTEMTGGNIVYKEDDIPCRAGILRVSLGQYVIFYLSWLGRFDSVRKSWKRGLCPKAILADASVKPRVDSAGRIVFPNKLGECIVIRPGPECLTFD